MNLPKDTLLKYFKICSTVVSKREKDELLYKGVRVLTERDKVLFSANGNFNAILCILPDSEISQIEMGKSESLDMVIEASKTIEILNRTTKKTVGLEKSQKQNLAFLKANGKNQLRYVDSINLPELPQIVEDSVVGQEEIESLYKFMTLLKPFTSEDIHKTQLVGTCFAEGNIYGTDEHKALTLRDTGIDLPNITISTELVDILHLLLSYEDTPENWEFFLTVDNSFFVLKSISEEGQPQYYIYTHRYNMEYPYDLLEKANEQARDNDYYFNFVIKDVLLILDRISIFADENDLLFIKVSENKVTFIVKNLKTNEKGEESIKISGELMDTVIPVSLSAFLAILSNFKDFLDELTIRYSVDAMKNFVSFNYDEFDAWIMKNLVELGDNEEI